MPPAPPTHKPRRTHHKTRTGCAVCRRRKIKCDEGKPHCQNCQRRGLSCEYFPTAAAAASANHNNGQVNNTAARLQSRKDNGDREEVVNPYSENGTRGGTTAVRANLAVGRSALTVPPSSATPKTGTVGVATLNIEDLELMYWYTSRTYRTFTPRRDIQLVWRDLVVRKAFKPCNHFLLHGILALAALHRATVEWDKERWVLMGVNDGGNLFGKSVQFQMAAARHWELTLSGFRDAMISGRNKDTSEGMFSDSTIMAIYALGECFFDPDSQLPFDDEDVGTETGAAPTTTIPGNMMLAFGNGNANIAIYPYQQAQRHLIQQNDEKQTSTYFLPHWWNLLRGIRALYLLTDVWNWATEGELKVMLPHKQLFFNSKPNPYQGELARLDELLEGCEDEFVDITATSSPTGAFQHAYENTKTNSHVKVESRYPTPPPSSKPHLLPDPCLTQLVQTRLSVYQETLMRIRVGYSQFFNEEEIPVASVISFPISCTDEYVKLLNERKPRALILLAHYVVMYYLLEQIPEQDLEEDLAPELTMISPIGPDGMPTRNRNKCGKIWWSRGVARREIRRIERYLKSVSEEEGRRSGDPERWLRWLEWPKKTVSERI